MMKQEIYLDNTLIPDSQSVIIENTETSEENIEIYIYDFFTLISTHTFSNKLKVTTDSNKYSMCIFDEKNSSTLNTSNKIVSMNWRTIGAVNPFRGRLDIHLFTRYDYNGVLDLYPHRVSCTDQFNNRYQFIELYLYRKNHLPTYLRKYSIKEFTDKFFSELQHNAHIIANMNAGDYLYDISEEFNKLKKIVSINCTRAKIPGSVYYDTMDNERESISLAGIIHRNMVVIPSDAYIYNTANDELIHDYKSIIDYSLLIYVKLLCIFTQTPYAKNIFIKNTMIEALLKNKDFKIPEEFTENSRIYVITELEVNDVSKIHNEIYNIMKKENKND